MNTMIGTIPMDAVLTMLNSLSRHDRRWLVEQRQHRLSVKMLKQRKTWKNW